MGPWVHGPPGLCAHGLMRPWPLGPMGPWAHGVVLSQRRDLHHENLQVARGKAA